MIPEQYYLDLGMSMKLVAVALLFYFVCAGLAVLKGKK